MSVESRERRTSFSNVITFFANEGEIKNPTIEKINFEESEEENLDFFSTACKVEESTSLNILSEEAQSPFSDKSKINLIDSNDNPKTYSRSHSTANAAKKKFSQSRAKTDNSEVKKASKMFTVLNFLTPKKKKIKKFPSGNEEIKQTTYEKVVFDAQRTTPLNNNEAYWVVKGSLESDKIHKDLKYNPFLAVNSIIRWPEQNNQNLDPIVRALRKIKKEYCDSTNDFSENSWTKRFDELMTMFSIDTNAWPLFFAYANSDLTNVEYECLMLGIYYFSKGKNNIIEQITDWNIYEINKEAPDSLFRNNSISSKLSVIYQKDQLKDYFAELVKITAGHLKRFGSIDLCLFRNLIEKNLSSQKSFNKLSKDNQQKAIEEKLTANSKKFEDFARKLLLQFYQLQVPDAAKEVLKIRRTTVENKFPVRGLEMVAELFFQRVLNPFFFSAQEFKDPLTNKTIIYLIKLFQNFTQNSSSIADSEHLNNVYQNLKTEFLEQHQEFLDKISK